MPSQDLPQLFWDFSNRSAKLAEWWRFSKFLSDWFLMFQFIQVLTRCTQTCHWSLVPSSVWLQLGCCRCDSHRGLRNSSLFGGTLIHWQPNWILHNRTETVWAGKNAQAFMRASLPYVTGTETYFAHYQMSIENISGYLCNNSHSWHNARQPSSIKITWLKATVWLLEQYK